MNAYIAPINQLRHNPLCTKHNNAVIIELQQSNKPEDKYVFSEKTT